MMAKQRQEMQKTVCIMEMLSLNVRFSGTYDEALDIYQLIHDLKEVFLDFWKSAEENSERAKSVIPMNVASGEKPEQIIMLCSCQKGDITIPAGAKLTQTTTSLDGMRRTTSPTDQFASKEGSMQNRQGFGRWFSRAKSDDLTTSTQEPNCAIPGLCFQPVCPDPQAMNCVQLLYKEMLSSWSTVVHWLGQILLSFITAIFDQWTGLRFTAEIPWLMEATKQDIEKLLTTVEDTFRRDLFEKRDFQALVHQITLIRLALVQSVKPQDQLGPNQSPRVHKKVAGTSWNSDSSPRYGQIKPDTNTFYRQRQELQHLLDKYLDFMNLKNLCQAQQCETKENVVDESTQSTDSAEIRMMFREIIQNAPRGIIWEYLSRCKVTPNTAELGKLLSLSAVQREQAIGNTSTETSTNAVATTDELTAVSDADFQNPVTPTLEAGGMNTESFIATSPFLSPSKPDLFRTGVNLTINRRQSRREKTFHSEAQGDPDWLKPNLQNGKSLLWSENDDNQQTIEVQSSGERIGVR
ncbi:hypothetical protein D915_003594 [Fasciola hepatica]|uniref:Uncharacterized protein n=1 Tax=Fasciola hepatica TaxID=6192 RepID=A0A4E0RG61_FASHE|nr:hypothetical protein D915_003594 [Fasciola hepatica]